MRKFITKVALAAGIAVAALPLGVASADATTSPEGEVEVRGGCAVKICGTVLNKSGHDIWAIRTFDSNGPKPGTEWRRLKPGQKTPKDQDWDGVYVKCKAKGTLSTWTFPGFWWDEDWKGKAGWWYKIRTHQDIHVEKQYC